MNRIDLLDIKEPQKDIKRPKRPFLFLKAALKAKATMVWNFCIFLPFWDHWDLTEWKMCLIWIPRPERPLEGRLIVELESCYCGGEYFQICFPSIDCDIYKCPKYNLEWIPEKQPKKAKKGHLEESKFKDMKKIKKYDFSANFMM